MALQSFVYALGFNIASIGRYVLKRKEEKKLI